MNEPCLLCGLVSSTEVRVSLARYLVDVEAGKPFSSIPRCVNRSACRERVLSKGEPWPVADTVAELPRDPVPA